MAFYRSQKINAVAVYSRQSGLFVGMIRLVAIESTGARLARESFETQAESARFDIRWHAAGDFQQQPFHYAVKQEIPAYLSSIFNKFANNEETLCEQDDQHVLLKCDPWFSPEQTLEQALKKAVTFKDHIAA